MSEAEEIERLLERAADADADAVDGLLLRYRKRIKRIPNEWFASLPTPWTEDRPRAQTAEECWDRPGNVSIGAELGSPKIRA